MSMVMVKPTKLEASTLPKCIHQKQRNGLLKEAKFKLANRNCALPPKNQELRAKSEKHSTDNFVEEYNANKPLDLCEQVEHISSQLAKLTNQHPVDKFMRNSEHRGYIMSYPEVLPVYTASKLSHIQPKGNYRGDLDVSPMRIQHLSPFTTAITSRSPEFGKDRHLVDLSDHDIAYDCESGKEAGKRKIEHLCPSDCALPRNESKYHPVALPADELEGTLEELASHLLRRRSPSPQLNNRKSQGHKPREPKQSESVESNKRQLHSPSSVLSRAALTLEAVNRRRIHLENNLEALGRTQFSQSIFEILQQLGESGSSIEKARVQARIIDAIEAAQKKKCSLSRFGGPTGTLQKKPKGSVIQRSSSQSPGPCSARTLTEFFSTEFESGDMTRSVSPSMRPAPWRINRSRFKRPGYPRIVNDPMPARRATLRLGEQKDIFVVPKGTAAAARANSPRIPTQPIRVQKAVHFHPCNTPDHTSRSANRSTRSTSSACQTKELRITSGIIPLGRAQYSALTPSMESVKSDQDQGANIILRDRKSTQNAAVEISSDIRLDVEDGRKSEHQPQCISSFSDGEALGNRTQPAAGTLSEVDVRALIEAAMLKHVHPETPCTPDNISGRLPTPDMSPDLDVYSDRQQQYRHSLQTPIHSPNQLSPTRSSHSRMDVAVGFPSHTSPIFSCLKNHNEAGTSYEMDELSDHAVITPKSSSTSSSSAIQTPCSPRPLTAESIRRSAAVYIQTSPVHVDPTTENVARECSSFSSSKDLDFCSGTEGNLESDIEFSLTAANTFSDGLWLIDRSEGEAPQPMVQEAYEKIAGNANLRLLPSTTQLSVASESSKSTTNDDYRASDRRLSDGELPQAHQAVRRPDPMTNPLLEIMALRSSERFHLSNLTGGDRKQVTKIASKLRSSELPSLKNLDWLAGLSGMKTDVFPKTSMVARSSSSTESEGIWNHAENNNKVMEDQETEWNLQPNKVYQSSSLSTLGEDIPINGVTKISDTIGEPVRSDEPLVHLDSDTTSINEPVYEDDYVTDTGTPSLH